MPHIGECPRDPGPGRKARAPSVVSLPLHHGHPDQPSFNLEHIAGAILSQKMLDLMTSSRSRTR